MLSALSGLPLNQGIAVTGAVNQHSEVQAVGGVTRKVKGFYDLCRERGPTGEQGVMVPAANVKNLMLKEEVVEAVRAGRFHVWGSATSTRGSSCRWSGWPANEQRTGLSRGDGAPAGPGSVAGVYGAGTQVWQRLARRGSRWRTEPCEPNSWVKSG